MRIRLAIETPRSKPGCARRKRKNKEMNKEKINTYRDFK